METQLTHKHAVIFGAGGAVGTAVAKEFATQGATVFLSGRTLGAVEQVAQEIHQDGGIAYAAEVDALDEQAVQTYLDHVAQEAGSIDILLNTTGPQPKDYGNSTSTLELPLEQFMLPFTTVAKTVNYPKQDRAIHTIVGTQPWAVTIAEKPNHTNQDSNRFFPTESGEHEDSSAATATPSQWPYRSLA